MNFVDFFRKQISNTLLQLKQRLTLNLSLAYVKRAVQWYHKTSKPDQLYFNQIWNLVRENPFDLVIS